jgi:hypothetical protein
MRGSRAVFERVSSARTANRMLRLAGLGLCIPPVLPAQSVSPPIAEYQEHARSSFQLSNGSVYPLNVVLELRGFRVNQQGEVLVAPIDTNRLKVKLSTMSFRIPPRSTYTVFYEAHADSLPAWFNIVSAITGARTDEGLNVRILLPHVVYLNQKQRLQPEDVVVRAFEFDSARHTVRTQLENLSPRLGRVLEVASTDGRQHTTPSGGFPLFPHSLRWAEATWPGTDPPTRLIVRTSKFTLDTVLTAVPDFSRVVAGASPSAH